MPVNWNGIEARAAALARDGVDASDARAEAWSFWIAFFDIFGIRRPRAVSFEHAVTKHGGARGFIDLFWPGVLPVEHKSRGKSLERAHGQAPDCFPGLEERDLPRYAPVTDVARVRLCGLEAGDDVQFTLAELPRHIDPFAFVAGYSTRKVRPRRCMTPGCDTRAAG